MTDLVEEAATRTQTNHRRWMGPVVAAISLAAGMIPVMPAPVISLCVFAGAALGLLLKVPSRPVRAIGMLAFIIGSDPLMLWAEHVHGTLWWQPLFFVMGVMVTTYLVPIEPLDRLFRQIDLEKD
ncbi:MAG TPA: hypothetical protein VFO66_03910 [Gemmatimonadaceae bacterium]|nr:hypothetical protein [Gemmatimonadaceae bacterium]